jgi:hypothetical protein
MIPIPSGVRVWIATGHTDMPRGMNSLADNAARVLKTGYSPAAQNLISALDSSPSKTVCWLWLRRTLCMTQPPDLPQPFRSAFYGC